MSRAWRDDSIGQLSRSIKGLGPNRARSSGVADGKGELKLPSFRVQVNDFTIEVNVRPADIRHALFFYDHIRTENSDVLNARVFLWHDQPMRSFFSSFLANDGAKNIGSTKTLIRVLIDSQPLQTGIPRRQLYRHSWILISRQHFQFILGRWL